MVKSAGLDQTPRNWRNSFIFLGTVPRSARIISLLLFRPHLRLQLLVRTAQRRLSSEHSPHHQLTDGVAQRSHARLAHLPLAIATARCICLNRPRFCTWDLLYVAPERVERPFRADSVCCDASIPFVSLAVRVQRAIRQVRLGPPLPPSLRTSRATITTLLLRPSRCTKLRLRLWLGRFLLLVWLNSKTDEAAVMQVDPEGANPSDEYVKAQVRLDPCFAGFF